mmetsp:Transcript_40650/g.91386  ORF Transcript_40650/g.91386 Transcript_40650/m.91386 type:complete len:205 (+) Transcript_40650:202-816(+)
MLGGALTSFTTSDTSNNTSDSPFQTVMVSPSRARTEPRTLAPSRALHVTVSPLMGSKVSPPPPAMSSSSRSTPPSSVGPSKASSAAWSCDTSRGDRPTFPVRSPSAFLSQGLLSSSMPVTPRLAKASVNSAKPCASRKSPSSCSTGGASLLSRSPSSKLASSPPLIDARRIIPLICSCLSLLSGDVGFFCAAARSALSRSISSL